jgi:hypothetical protein
MSVPRDSHTVFVIQVGVFYGHRDVAVRQILSSEMFNFGSDLAINLPENQCFECVFCHETPLGETVINRGP